MLQTLQKAGDGLCISNICTAVALYTLVQPGAASGGLRQQGDTEWPTWLVPRVSSHRDRAKSAHPFLSVPLPSIAW